MTLGSFILQIMCQIFRSFAHVGGTDTEHFIMPRLIESDLLNVKKKKKVKKTSTYSTASV